MNTSRHILLIALSLILIFAKSAISKNDCYDESTKQRYPIGKGIQIENQCKLKVCMDYGSFEVYGCPEYIYASKRVRRDTLKRPFPQCCRLWDLLHNKNSNNRDKKNN